MTVAFFALHHHPTEGRDGDAKRTMAALAAIVLKDYSPFNRRED
ncbi:hypothetical protein [Polaromonas glacialis]|nr:hypothetical protein [Polaromonas glacialis]